MTAEEPRARRDAERPEPCVPPETVGTRRGETSGATTVRPGRPLVTNEPQPLCLREILSLPGVEQIVDDREQAFLGRIPRLREVVIEMRLVDGLDGRVDVRVGREHHATRLRIDLAGSRKHFGSLNAWHPLVADDERQ